MKKYCIIISKTKALHFVKSERIFLYCCSKNSLRDRAASHIVARLLNPWLTADKVRFIEHCFQLLVT
ncbi:unnamed protein product [Acanthoscelides obtectus]|uniref:Uncharacterized protein n=1 Tax=Acanthoscelides obtectus TaxID=200917 RepID=A0A9P0L211_ACAOB|nr:unnamed protein product [Acanthoscelides obtectus]CAK1629551.1 hypothetical protein AOBTE_LOCUS5812 [Acanthoscelides obtectus]